MGHYYRAALAGDTPKTALLQNAACANATLTFGGIGMRNFILAAAVLCGATAAQAVTYDAVADFGPNPVAWTYGTGTVGGSFAALPNYVTTGCVGITDLACHNDMNAEYTFPAFGKNLSGSDPLVFYTNVLSKTELFVQTLANEQAILRFTAQDAGTYNFAGAFRRIDNSDGSGNGVTVGYYNNGVTKSGDLAKVFGSTFAINHNYVLAAGGTVDFFLDAKGDVNYDGTGLSLSVASVPETASWAMMVAGFGLLGAMSRRRRIVSANA